MKKILLFTALSLIVVLSSCGREQTLSERIGDMAAPYTFSLVRWEEDMISQEIDEHVRHPYPEDSADSDMVNEYFDLVAQENSLRQQIGNIQCGFAEGDTSAIQSQLDALSTRRKAMERQTEEILAFQMRQAAAELGIYNPLDSFWSVKATFPPVLMRLQEPPQLLVVSPRERIDRIAGITLISDVSQEDAVSLENQVEEMGLSAIVVGLGGIATYPSFVSNIYGLRTALDIAAEEWFHQYLFFRPLGFRYGLDQIGITQPLDIVIMNETLAGMVAQELAARVYTKFYPQAVLASLNAQATRQDYDFYGEMHITRIVVDALLAQGMVDAAESYMETRRLEFAEHGYFIRKLNQAYFAFYGSYANQPGFENTISVDLKTLRDRSATLAEFVQLASSFSSREALAEAVR